MKKNEKTAIFNYWWTSNYGAILTAYALQTLISNSYCINDWKTIFYKSKWLDIATKKLIKTFEIKQGYKEHSFLNDFFDNFVVGSDQVFNFGESTNYVNMEHFNKYLLNFAKLNKRKIAFSASFGHTKEDFIKRIHPQKLELMKMSLKTFDFISVREKSGVQICKDLFNINAEWIIDPVFILDKSKYENLIKNSTKDYSNKIISYVLDTNNEYKKAYKYLSKKYNLDIIELANSNESVENWLTAIKNSKFLITDSFHGLCFAIIFNKPFICITNKKRGATRFESILEMLNIENQCINNINEIYKKDCIFKINYEKVNQRIVEEAKRGLNSLKKALDTPISEKEEKIEAKIQCLENRVIELDQQNNLKYQINKELWYLWLIIFHKHLPNSIKNIIRFMRDKNVRKK